MDDQYTDAQLKDGTTLRFKGQLNPDQIRVKVQGYRQVHPQQAATPSPTPSLGFWDTLKQAATGAASMPIAAPMGTPQPGSLAPHFTQSATVEQGGKEIFGTDGYPEMYHGASDIYHAKDINPAHPMRARAAGASRVIGGAMEAAKPLMYAGAVEAPLMTARVIATGIAAQKGVRAGLTKVGVAPEYAELGGDVAGLAVPGASEGAIAGAKSGIRSVGRDVAGALDHELSNFDLTTKSNPPASKPAQPLSDIAQLTADIEKRVSDAKVQASPTPSVKAKEIAQQEKAVAPKIEPKPQPTEAEVQEAIRQYQARQPAPKAQPLVDKGSRAEAMPKDQVPPPSIEKDIRHDPGYTGNDYPDAKTMADRSFKRFQVADSAYRKAARAGDEAKMDANHQERLTHLKTWAQYAPREDVEATVHNLETPAHEKLMQIQEVLSLTQSVSTRTSDQVQASLQTVKSLRIPQRLFDINKESGELVNRKELEAHLEARAAKLRPQLEMAEALKRGKQFETTAGDARKTAGLVPNTGAPKLPGPAGKPRKLVQSPEIAKPEAAAPSGPIPAKGRVETPVAPPPSVEPPNYAEMAKGEFATREQAQYVADHVHGKGNYIVSSKTTAGGKTTYKINETSKSQVPQAKAVEARPAQEQASASPGLEKPSPRPPTPKAPRESVPPAEGPKVAAKEIYKGHTLVQKDNFWQAYDKKGNFVTADSDIQNVKNHLDVTKAIDSYEPLSTGEKMLIETRLNKNLKVSDELLKRYRREYGVHPNDPERGSFSLRGARQQPPPNPSSSLGQLTTEVQAEMRTKTPGSWRMRAAESVADRLSEGKDLLTRGLNVIHAQGLAMKESYLRLPEWTDFKASLGRWQGSLQRNAAELRAFSKAIQDRVPNKDDRVGITNYLQAGGDLQTLRDRMNLTTDPKLKRGYQRALNLTPEQRAIGDGIRTYFDKKLLEARQLGVFHQGVENYVNQVWRRQNPYTQRLISTLRNDALRTKPMMSNKRVFDSYFEGEQSGFAPMDKDIGFLVNAYDQAFNTAIASRGFIKELLSGTAKDGRPVVEVSGSGRPLPDAQDPDAYILTPKSKPEDLGDYRVIDHSALRDWKWVSKTEDGTPMFMQGDLLVHPDHFQHLKNVLTTSALRNNPVGRAVLKGSTTLKAALFSFSGFHQVQEGVHAFFHKVNAFHPEQIDWQGPIENELIDHGLQISEYSGHADFSEGLNSSGFFEKVPIAGPIMQGYQHYLFQDYIPRLKMQMGREAFARNLDRYDAELKAGRVTRDQIAELTANQANAAFGELNYKMLGRSQTVQDVMRLITIAPDFLEARFRFAGQALKPYGREQSAALLRGALGMYVGARVLNKTLDDDYHFDVPFGVVVHGYQYSLRSVPGDAEHLMEDPRSFIYHRLNPSTTRPIIEAVTGRDEFGRAKPISEQMMDLAKNLVPVPAQGALNKYNDTTLGTTVLESLGVHRAKYRTGAENLAHKMAMDKIPPGFQSRGLSRLATRLYEGTADMNEVRARVLAGELSPDDITSVMEKAQKSPFERDFSRLSLQEAIQVWAVARPAERQRIAPEFADKLDDLENLPPKEQEATMQLLSRLQ